MKIAVITSSVESNIPAPPIIYRHNVEYHAFLDSKMCNLSIDGWRKHKALDFTSFPFFKNRRNAKIYKILPFLFLPGFDYYIYIDCTHRLEKDPEEIIDTYLSSSDIAVFKHPYRNCVYDEGEEVKTIDFDIRSLVDDQLNFYKEEGYPYNNGLYELPVRIQRNTEDIQRLCLMWWEQICKFSSRDQISFPFVCFKTNIKPAIMPGKANEYRSNDIIPQVAGSTHRRTL